VIATGNPGKRQEIEDILAGAGVEVASLEGYGEVSFPEEGLDYRENAIAKAQAAASQIGEIAVADDSGIEVDALGGAPGPISARYGGEGLDDAGRVAKLLGELEEVPAAGRKARFVCYAALATPKGDTIVAFGECKGEILAAPQGDGGFGYDPVFRADGHQGSMAETPTDVKNKISHRARALQDLFARWGGTDRS